MDDLSVEFSTTLSELKSEFVSRSENDAENSTDKSNTEKTIIKSKSGVEWSLQTNNFNTGVFQKEMY